MRVIVQLRNTRDLRARDDSGDDAAFASVLAEHSLTAQPLHPNTQDPTLASFYSVEVPPHRSVDDLLRQLHALNGVEAAYVKPPDELP
jgi:hypothetical protein